MAMVGDHNTGAAVRASASLDGKNCLIHALTRIYVQFFNSILYVNFQFGLNEYSDYLALLLPSSSLLRKGIGLQNTEHNDLS